MFCIVNGQLQEAEKATIGINDLALLRGYGIFDFFRLVDNNPLFFDDHLDRFYQSSQIAQLPILYTKDALKLLILQMINKNQMPVSGIRIVLTGGYSTDGYNIGVPNLIITQEKISFPSKEKFEKGVSLITYNHQRELPEIKTIGYMTGIWLDSEIKKNKAYDVLYHSDGNVLELTRSNIFIVKKNNIIVTPSNKILKGITRKQVLKLAREHYHVEERNITIDELFNAREVFITGTTKKVLPIVDINGEAIASGKPGKITTHLLELFEKHSDKTF